MENMLSITKSNYGNYGSSNYGSHTQKIRIGDLALWFSYNTVVAFSDYGHLRRVIKNQWSTTTGKHLNWIDGGDKKSRLSREQFEKELQEVLKKHTISIKN